MWWQHQRWSAGPNSDRDEEHHEDGRANYVKQLDWNPGGESDICWHGFAIELTMHASSIICA